MKYVYLTLNWIIGVLFGLTGLISLVESLLEGVCLIAISALLLPPVRNAIYSKTQKELPFKARAVSVFVLFIAFAIFVGQSQERKVADLEARKAEEQAQKVAKTRQENIDYFKAHKAEVMSSASSALSKKNYQLVINQTTKYLPSEDAELNGIYNQARNAIDAIKRIEREEKKKLEREAKTKALLAKLKKVPASEFKENKDLYRQLLNLNPDDKAYQKKFDHYSQKLSQQKEKERKEQEKLKKEEEVRIAIFGEPPVQSVWDGSYYEVERYLERVANDPDSIDIDGCTKVYHSESGWLVGCDYRGRNGFGGMIRQSNWFTIIHGQVIQMHDASAYSQ